jgi:hypothetical protein
VIRVFVGDSVLPEFFSVDGSLVGPVSECDLILAFRALHWMKTGQSYNFETVRLDVTFHDPFGMIADDRLSICAGA